MDNLQLGGSSYANIHTSRGSLFISIHFPLIGRTGTIQTGIIHSCGSFLDSLLYFIASGKEEEK
jgi:hypothetical protein